MAGEKAAVLFNFGKDSFRVGCTKQTAIWTPTGPPPIVCFSLTGLLVEVARP
jgi:hypothetical protein